MGGKSPQTCTRRESTRFYAAPYMGNNGNLRKFEAHYRHGTVFAPKKCCEREPKAESEREPKNVIIAWVEKVHKPVRTWKVTGFIEGPYMGDKGNLRKCGAPYRHGTVFSPKKCAYQKEAMGKESPKIYSLRGCKKSPQTCAIRESNRFYEAPYMGDNGNLRKFGAPYRHGTVFAPNKCA